MLTIVQRLVDQCRAQFPTLREICRQIDEELEFHAESARRHLLAQPNGASGPDNSGSMAEAPFVGMSEVRAELIGIALRSRRQAGACVLGVLCAICAGLGSYGMVVSDHLSTEQRQTAQLIRALQITEARLDVADGESRMQLAQTVHQVRLEGHVAKPRLWTLPRDRTVTVRQLLARSGEDDLPLSVRVVIVSEEPGAMVVTIEPDDWSNPDGTDYPITSSCSVYVQSVDSGGTLNQG